MIEPMLVRSTAHIGEQTCNSWLHNAPFAAFGKGDYGWFVHVPDDEPEDLPADLGACLTQARSLRLHLGYVRSRCGYCAIASRP